MTPLTVTPGSSVHGILQARILERIAIPFLQGNLPNPGIKSKSPSLQADSLPPEPPWKRLQITHSTRQWGAQYFLLWKLTELKKQDGRLQSYESLGLNFHSALTACGFGQVPSPAGLTGLGDLVPEPPYCPPLAGWAQQPCRMEWAGEEYKHICFLDCRFSSLIQKIGS